MLHRGKRTAPEFKLVPRYEWNLRLLSALATSTNNSQAFPRFLVKYVLGFVSGMKMETVHKMLRAPYTQS